LAACWQRSCGSQIGGAIIILVTVEIIAVAAVFAVMPDVQERFATAVVNSLPAASHSDYYVVIGAGLTVF
jgi:hypothetical protein